MKMLFFGLVFLACLLEKRTDKEKKNRLERKFYNYNHWGIRKKVEEKIETEER